MSWLIQRKFLVLLIMLTMLVVVYPILHSNFQNRFIWNLLLTGLFLAMFFVTFTERHLQVPALCLAFPTIVGSWVGYVLPSLPSLPLVVGFHLMAPVFLVFTTAAILRSIYRAAEVTADGIYGAFCGYILVGVTFGHFYCVLEALVPGSYQLGAERPNAVKDQDTLFFMLGYFSMVTLTTLGYGDIVPISHGARGLAVVEAIAGQFYIAVLIGELIGKRVSSALAGKEKKVERKGSQDDTESQ